MQFLILQKDNWCIHQSAQTLVFILTEARWDECEMPTWLRHASTWSELKGLLNRCIEYSLP